MYFYYLTGPVDNPAVSKTKNKEIISVILVISERIITRLGNQPNFIKFMDTNSYFNDYRFVLFVPKFYLYFLPNLWAQTLYFNDYRFVLFVPKFYVYVYLIYGHKLFILMIIGLCYFRK